MTEYFIKITGCDDATEFLIDLTEVEAVALRRVAAFANATSRHGCQPRINVRVAAGVSFDDGEYDELLAAKTRTAGAS